MAVYQMTDFSCDNPMANRREEAPLEMLKVLWARAFFRFYRKISYVSDFSNVLLNIS